MKTIKLLFISIISVFTISSCTSVYYDSVDDFPPTLEEVITSYDLWYVDYNATQGDRDVPFMARAFTLSFVNGVLFANNNMVDVGRTGNGLGIDVGVYNTFNGILNINHDIDRNHSFEVTVLSRNRIELYNYNYNVSYYLIGYNVNNFDYDQLFYDNIEYFLQEYTAWEKVSTSGGTSNAFDAENYLAFTPENITTFYSSQDNLGTNIDLINWDYVGSYQVFDVTGNRSLKVLELYYDGGDVEEFDVTVTNDNTIRLYHISSNTIYTFRGRGFIQYLKSSDKKKEGENVRDDGRIRTKVIRKSKSRNT